MRLQEVIFSVLMVLQCWLTLLLPESWAAVVVQGPQSTSKEVGGWAEFNCSVACTHSIRWYIEGYTSETIDSCSTMLEGMKVCREVLQQCTDETSSTVSTERLRMKVTEELAASSIAVQCSGLARTIPTSSCPPIISYSMVALLTIPEIPTSVPSPSPVICPSTVQAPASQSIITSTVVKTITVTITASPVMVTVTNLPSSDSAISRGTPVGGKLSQVMTELLSWSVWILAWFLMM